MALPVAAGAAGPPELENRLLKRLVKGVAGVSVEVDAAEQPESARAAASQAAHRCARHRSPSHRRSSDRAGPAQRIELPRRMETTFLTMLNALITVAP
jgi:hypothetical protein